ncbi:hypothetical protein GF342_03505 [Candidatus Woesearchaeota archaeon]|nr:hypothetical protein [Candidatus Woesearchaeota archaeon]
MRFRQLFLISIIFYAFLLRVWNLAALSFWIDESFSILSAIKVLEHGVPLLDSGLLYARSLPHTYLLSAMGVLFGFGEWPMRLPSVLLGVLAVWLVYRCASIMISSRAGLCAAALTALSHTQVLWSRQARMYMLLEVLLFAALFFALWWQDKGLYKFLVLSACSAFLASFTHVFGSLAFIPLMVLLLEKRRLWIKHAKNLKLWQSLSLVFAILVFAVYASWTAFSLFSHYTLINLSRFYSGYLFDTSFAVILFALVGIAVIKPRYAVILGSIFVATFCMASFFSGAIHMRYLSFVLPVLFILSSALLDFCFSHSSIGKMIALFGLLAILWTGFLFVPSVPRFNDQTPQPNFRAAAAFIAHQDSGIIASAYSAPLLVYGVEPDFVIDFDMQDRERHSWHALWYGTDYYSGLPTIMDVQDLLAARPHYILVDDLALSRLDKTLASAIKNNSIAFEDDPRWWDGIRVYEMQ